MDHHCPWVNNCVGIQTQKQFILFNIYSLILVIYVLTILLPQFSYELKESFTNDYAFTSSMCLISCTLVECLCFMLLVFTILIDQISAIALRTQVIDHIKFHSKKINKPRRRAYENFCVVFGTDRFRLSWFIPKPISGNFKFEDLYH